jgi:hypothetical protein
MTLFLMTNERRITHCPVSLIVPKSVLQDYRALSLETYRMEMKLQRQKHIHQQMMVTSSQPTAGWKIPSDTGIPTGDQ